MADGDINLIDSRLSTIKEVLEEAVAEYGADIISITSDVDIETITGLCGHDGNKKSRKYLEFLNSTDEGKVESVDSSGNRQEVPIFLNREISNGLVRASEGRVGTADEMVKSVDRLREQLNNYFSGGGNPTAKAINAKELEKVRSFMGVMSEVFGFNSAEQLEMFIAAWLAPDTTTRLSGIPGTGKTTLIECASLMFGNSYGFVSDYDSEYNQVWDSLRTEQQTREWEDRRFHEQSYRYPFNYLLRDIFIPTSVVASKDGNKTNFTLKEFKSGTKDFMGGDYGIGGKLRNTYFSIADKALRDNRIILFADDEGIIPSINSNSLADADLTNYTPAKGWFKHPPLTQQQMADGKDYAFYQGVTVDDFKALYDDYKSSYAAASKGDKGEPISVDGGDATALDKALLYYNNQTVVDSVMKMIQQLESGKRSARRFIAKIYFDSRVEHDVGIKRIDSEMRKEIGIAKVDKDKRAEQILYGVDITAQERGERTGLTQYEFTPYPREIVTQPIKFFNEVNRSQASVEDAILGLIAEKEVEYRGQVFSSPNFTAFMDTNPHVGGNDLAFTDRIDMELMFPSALLDQRYKILKGGLSDEAQSRSEGGVEKPTPRRRVLRKILDGEITPLRYEDLKKIWKDTKAVSYETSGYNALMDISIVSMLFAQRFGVHEPDATVSLDFAVPFKQENNNMITHNSNSGNYASSLKPINSSGYFIDASVSESKAYRNDMMKSKQAISRGHGAMALLDRVLAFRFTNSLAKLSRALAYLRGNAYVTRKEIMDVLPYVVGHRIGRAKGDGGNMEYGIKDDAAKQFASGQEFVREAIVQGYLERTVDSFGSTSMGNTGDWAQSRWVEWDSTIAQARKDLASARTYSEYEMKMWAMSRMASGDGNPDTEAGTGDPMPYLIYRLVLMEEMAANDPNKVLHPFINPESENRDIEVYDKRIEYYQRKISDFLTAPASKDNPNYAAADVAILRRKIALERWLSIEDKLALLNQADSILDGITGTQIPDNFGPLQPAGGGGTSTINLKLSGIYGACTDELPDEFADIDLDNMRMYLGFPINSYIRGHTWYGGSNTGRAKQILYRGVLNQLDSDAYMGIKTAAGGDGDVLTEGNAIYPTASKTNIQQSVVFRGSCRTDDDKERLYSRLEDFMNDIDQTFEFFAGCELEVGSTGTPKEKGYTEIVTEVMSMMDDVQSSDDADTETRSFICEVGNIEREFINPIKDLNLWDETGLKILGTDDDRLRLYIDVVADNNQKYVELNFCLSSTFVKLGAENNLEVVGLTDTDPLGANDLGATYENKNTFFDLGNMTLFAALSFDQLAKKYA